MDEWSYVGEELEVFAHARNWKRYVAKALRPHIRGRVLEVGAGIGTTTRALWTPEALEWVCLEPDRNLRATLSERIREGPWGPAVPTVIGGTVSDIDPAQRIDTILYIDVLEHILDDRSELKEAERRLGPGGRIIVLAPAIQALFSPFDRAIGHHRRYGRESLRRAFPERMHEDALFSIDSVGALTSLANRWLLRQAAPTLGQIRLWDSLMVPLSRLLDPLLGRRVGRSIVAIYRRPEARSAAPGAG